GGSGSYSYDSTTGTLNFNRSPIFTVGNEVFWPTAGGPANVTVKGAGITMSVYRTVPGLFRLYAPVGGAQRLTLSGVVHLQSGGSFGASPVYAGNATLVYRTGFN